ncbi:MAG: hypothetical protein ACI3ZL_00775 [Candidatus Cryptobacteroides sp.]
MIQPDSYGSHQAEVLLERGLSLMQAARFGEAVNVLRAAADTPGASSYVRSKALAAIGVIKEINGFVNVDLMNP